MNGDVETSRALGMLYDSRSIESESCGYFGNGSRGSRENDDWSLFGGRIGLAVFGR